MSGDATAFLRELGAILTARGFGVSLREAVCPGDYMNVWYVKAPGVGVSVVVVVPPDESEPWFQAAGVSDLAPCHALGTTADALVDVFREWGLLVPVGAR